MTGLAVRTESLRRTFMMKKEKGAGRKEVEALRGVDLEVREGELFGLLGPNGAGKTTLIKILCTLLLPTTGKAYVHGYDVDTDAQRIRSKISMVSGGEQAGYGLLTTHENIWMFSQFYGIPSRRAHERIDELLGALGMADKRDEKVRTLSTGQRQKMNLVRGLVTEPRILFLDEPTLGLDVNSAKVVRTLVRSWIDEDKGRTVLLTTHYMQEADDLCDRIAIISDGRIIACDTPEGLRKHVKQESVMTLKATTLPPATVEMMRTFKNVKEMSAQEDASEGTTTLRMLLEDESAVAPIMDAVVKSKSSILSLKKTQPTLEDVFLALVGKGLHD